MADDRPIEGTEDAVSRLQRELDDLKSTMNARMPRRPTGDIEPTLRATAKDGTLLLQGQTVTRAAYPNLWAWVVENNLAPAVFGNGDGVTTFVLPDLRGRTLTGADATNPLGTKFGSATTTLAAGNMPSHSHGLSGGITGVGDHDHDVTGGAGEHDGHNDRSGTCQPGVGIPYGVEPAGFHGHPMTWDGAHTHGHNLSVQSSGSSNPTPINTQPPSYSGNYLIWT